MDPIFKKILFTNAEFLLQLDIVRFFDLCTTVERVLYLMLNMNCQNVL